MPRIIDSDEAAELAKENGLRNTKQIRTAIQLGW